MHYDPRRFTGRAGRRGELDQTGSEAQDVLDLAAQITSSRTRETIRDLRRKFRGHEGVTEIGEFVERARANFGIAA